MRSYWIIIFFLFAFSTIYAQPANDECEEAIVLLDVTSWCSEVGEYSNEDATDSGYDAPTCFSDAHDDVWFAFTPVALDVTITVIGDQNQLPGGTLQVPEVSLYTGTCGGIINQEQCESDAGNNIIELYKGGLAIGLTYYIRVQGANGGTGTFQLCLNNYNPPVSPGSDCPTAAVLCNKDAFVVQQVVGPGDDPTEANDADCLNVFSGNVESNSTWFTWTALNDGPLTFTLTPLNPEDDLDFVVYELPNGPLDCTDKEVIRCMASGDFFATSPCMGPTGLNLESDDASEPAGCQLSTQDNFLAAVNMTEGTSYGLMVNNFSDSGNGFEIEFGGSGDFVGPQTAITTDDADLQVCIGEEISFADASTFDLGSIEEWSWGFGQGASMATSNSPGPHTITYETPGIKSVVLTITTDRGCIDTEVRTIEVVCCDGQFSVEADIQDVLCFDEATGAIDITVTSPYGPYGYSWSNGENTEDLSGIPQGSYTITVTDEASCDTILTYMVNSPPALEAEPMIVMPTCDGGTDGQIILNVIGGTTPYEYNWNNTGFSDDNTLSNIPQGDYPVTIRDDNGCELDLVVEVQELELLLDPSVAAIVPPSCTGFSDAILEVVISNGLPPYQYDFNNGNGYVDENTLTQLSAGTYIVDVQDANLCEGSFMFEILDPPPLTLDFSVENVSCNGESDGSLTAVVTGGTGDYAYAWSTGSNTVSTEQLPAGTYSLTVEDENGCEIEGTATVTEPAPVFVDITGIEDVLCFGDSTGVINVQASGGTSPYEYSVDGINFQTSEVFNNLGGGAYTITVMDAMGCTNTVEGTIVQPPELIVEAGPDQIIQLGYETTIRASANDATVTYTWTPPDGLSCTDCPNPTAMPVTSTTYLITIIDATGCTDVDSLKVLVVPDRPLYIPNVFSPNEDGINDAFTAYGGPAARIIKEVKIFNRWGGLVFENSDIPLGVENLGWDGTFRGQPVGTGVYTYFMEVEFIDDVIVLFEGDVTVVR